MYLDGVMWYVLRRLRCEKMTELVSCLLYRFSTKEIPVDQDGITSSSAASHELVVIIKSPDLFSHRQNNHATA